jgi:hypothetical protein
MSVFGFTGELAEVPQLGWWTHLFNHQTHPMGKHQSNKNSIY